MNYSLLLVASMVIAVQCYFIPMRFTHKRLVARESKYSRSNILVHMTDNDGDVGIADDEATVPETVDDLNITDATNQTEVVSTNATEVDPIALAITEEENRLRKKVQELESVLKSERLRSVKIRDKISEGGKTGFFIVQAQVAEFNVR